MERTWIIADLDGKNPRRVTLAQYRAAIEAAKARVAPVADAAAPDLLAERDRLKAINEELVAALTAITKTSVGIDEGNAGVQRAWSKCCAIARAALARAGA